MLSEIDRPHDRHLKWLFKRKFVNELLGLDSKKLFYRDVAKTTGPLRRYLEARIGTYRTAELKSLREQYRDYLQKRYPNVPALEIEREIIRSFHDEDMERLLLL